jgi:hypothetical protein
MEKTTRMGEPLTWSHLVALTRVRTGAGRRMLAEECLREGWTIRELAERVVAHVGESRGAAGGGGGVAEDGDEQESVRVALTEGIQSASRFAVHMGIFIEALEARLADADGDADLVEQAISAFEDVHEKVGVSLGRLRGASKPSGARVAVGPRVRVEVAGSEEAGSEASDVSTRRRLRP